VIDNLKKKWQRLRMIRLSFANTFISQLIKQRNLFSIQAVSY